jgi:O-methyltransferase
MNSTLKFIAARLYFIVCKRYLREIFMHHPPDPAITHTNMLASFDPIRYATLALAIHELRKYQVDGCFAELGAYRGQTSRIIHTLAPERTLYLFDTFEGVPAADLERPDNRFRDTSLDVLRRTIGDMTNVVIRKGYFPDTARGLEAEQFAFVMLDLDLYKPTRAALEFFYARMPSGGYIFAHDYNNPESDWGVSRAVDEFLRDKSEKPVAIPDKWGSVVIRKM